MECRYSIHGYHAHCSHRWAALQGDKLFIMPDRPALAPKGRLVMAPGAMVTVATSPGASLQLAAKVQESVTIAANDGTQRRMSLGDHNARH